MINNYVEKGNDIVYSIIILVYFILSEFLPDFLALDYSLMASMNNEISLKEEENGQVERIIIDSRKISLANPGESLSRNSSECSFRIEGIGNNTHNDTSEKKLHKTLNDLLVKSSDLHIHKVVFQRQYGLGAIHKAEYQNRDVICRLIKYERFSRYDMEGLGKDLDLLM